MHAEAAVLVEPETVECAGLFADASGFTALTEQLAMRRDGADIMCLIMNRFLGQVIDIVQEYGGDVVKFAGDAVSCIFLAAPGEAPADGPASPDMREAVARATACACELRRKLPTSGRRRRRRRARSR